MTLIKNNIKFIRKKLGLTQEQFSEKLGIKRSLLGAYEEGRAEPGLTLMMQMAQLGDISIESLISIDLNDEDALQKLKRKDIEGNKLRVLAISVDSDNKENIHLVPQKASAGYLNGYTDPEYIAELPTFYMPIFSQGSYRAFEIKGDSMLPMPSGSIIIGQYLENWQQVKKDKTYVVVSKSEGIVYKRIDWNKNNPDVFTLISDNKIYDPYEVSLEDIDELWEAKAFISTEFPKSDVALDRINSLVKNLQNELSGLKKE